MKDVVILGAGGFAREVLWVFEECNAEKKEWNVLGFLDENLQNKGRILCDVPVLGDFKWLEARSPKPLVISGVGTNPVRRKFADLARAAGASFCTVVHPSVRMTRFVTIGLGTVICAGNLITCQISIGDHVNINLDCTIGHDAVIESFCNISPGVHLSGYSHLEEDCDLGTGAVVLPSKRVGGGSVIGAGAVVTSDIPARSVPVGIPAKVVKTLGA